MDWSVVFYSALGGGGGALLGTLAFGLFQKLRGQTTVLNGTDKVGAGIRGLLVGGMAVLGVSALPISYTNMILPRIVPIDLSGAIENLPIFALLKEQSPEDYKRLIEPLDFALRNNKSEQEAINEVRVVYFDLLGKKSKMANADILRALDEIGIRQYEIYKIKQPSICTLIVNAEPYPSVVDLIGPELESAEQDVVLRLFTEPSRDPSFIADLARGKSLFEEISAQTVNESGITSIRPDITADSQNDVEHQKICSFAILLTEKGLQLSDDDLINFKSYLETLES